MTCSTCHEPRALIFMPFTHRLCEACLLAATPDANARHWIRHSAQQARLGRYDRPERALCHPRRRRGTTYLLRHLRALIAVSGAFPTVKELAIAAGMPLKTVYQMLYRLEAAGQIQRQGRGWANVTLKEAG